MLILAFSTFSIFSMENEPANLSIVQLEEAISSMEYTLQKAPLPSDKDEFIIEMLNRRPTYPTDKYSKKNIQQSKASYRRNYNKTQTTLAQYKAELASRKK